VPLIDDEGRIFGQFNLIDAIIGALLIGAIPISYGAFLLFRTPDPSILSIEPTQVTEGNRLINVGGYDQSITPDTVRVAGNFLSPSLRIVIGDRSAEAFLVTSQESAEIRLPNLSAGTYDIVLLDQEMEMSRLANALVVQPSETVMAINSFTPTYVFSGQPGRMRIHGERLWPRLTARFVSGEDIGGSAFTSTGEQYIEAPAFVLESSTAAEITIPVLPEGVYDVVLYDGDEERARSPHQFSVIATPTATSHARITVRFVSRPDVEFTMTVGDKDTSALPNGLGVDFLPNSNRLASLPPIITERIVGFLAQAPEELRQGILEALGDSSQQTAQETWAAALAGDQREQRRIIDILNREDQREQSVLAEVAEVQSVGSRRTMRGSATVGLPLSGPGPSYISDQSVEVFDAVLDVPVTLTRLGWSYGGQSVKVGSVFQMETLGYAAQGWVLDMEFLSRADQRP